MKEQNIYKLTTIFLALIFSVSAVLYLTNEVLKTAFMDLGFPAYFRVELGVAQILGSMALIFPVGRMLKEWAYAGFSFTLISASLAHWARSDELSKILIPLLVLILLLISYIYYRRIKS